MIVAHLCFVKIEDWEEFLSRVRFAPVNWKNIAEISSDSPPHSENKIKYIIMFDQTNSSKNEISIDTISLNTEFVFFLICTLLSVRL